MDLALESVPPGCPQIKRKKRKDTGTARLFFYDRFYCVGFSALTGYKSLLKTDTAVNGLTSARAGLLCRLLLRDAGFCGFLHWVTAAEKGLQGECPP